jgi:NAD dependent epimerase/dehydratase family enzyme
MSWITLDDLLGVTLDSLNRPDFSGQVNAVSLNPATNQEFTATLASVLRRPAGFRLPASVVRLTLGEMGRELLLAGARVRPQRLEAAGFRFLHPDLETALCWELGRFESPDPGG